MFSGTRNFYGIRRGGDVAWVTQPLARILTEDFFVFKSHVLVSWFEVQAIQATGGGRLKRWNGSAWEAVAAPKAYNGSAFVAGVLKSWDGSAWVT